ncbi:FAD-dependent monooxygenase [Streptomyces sp. ET3-23]|uniref:FAD-dependent monooxygenase n=1 Tax=Streptomyces sp. ET3-23 TaxID=2885643 RepID=UPI001D10957C|nr:FAD-dependent monooxygenase [Streptomyces sp. ET3-23]MCC2280457.1 FAD-dependent monooxygenase [Streptomyces sp. ET3-23]
MDASVVIVGAGPAGLMLAGELRLAGTDVVVLDRLPQRTGESRGIGLTPRTVEVFDQRGLLPRFGDIEMSSLGHFGGIPLDFGILGEDDRAAKTVPQSVTESVLEGWARDMGADIRRGQEFTGLRDLGDRVVVEVLGPAGRKELVARYVVGCDGGRSSVRKSAGFDFPGTSATTELFLADVRGIDIEPRMVADRVTDGMVMTSRLADGIHRIIVAERGAPPRRRTGPPAYAEVADLWKRLTGIDISQGEPLWVSAFGDATRQVTEYRRGRVLLAGDSAHIHLPAGGQGMNTSVQDAVNLGWKLAAVLRGTADSALLDSYHSERHEVGRRLLANTRAQSLLILGSDEVEPLRDILGTLMQYEDVARHFAAKAAGLDIRYDVGRGSNPLLGRRMPQLELLRASGITSSTELLRSGRGVLLDLEDTPQLRQRAAAWRDRVDIVTAVPQGVAPGSALDGAGAVLLRPDGHVAWIAPGSHHDLPSALERWFGQGQRHAVA